MISQTHIDKAAAFIQTNLKQPAPYCALGLIDDAGYPTISTITPAKADGIKTLWFVTGIGSNKTQRISGDNRACVHFCDAGETINITLCGRMEVLTGPEIAGQMWYQGLEHHFSGPADPAVCVLKFTTQRANLMFDYEEQAGPVSA